MDDPEFHFPPILPDLKEELRSYLICPEKLPIHRYERNQEFWPRVPNINNLFHHDVSPLCTTLKVQRDPNSGEITEFIEVPNPSAGATPQNSMSLNRAPAPPSEAIRGSASNVPFWPGGFPDPVIELPAKAEDINDDLLTVPPGFSRGLNFELDGFTVRKNKEETKFKFNQKQTSVNLIDLIQEEEDLLGIWQSPETVKSAETDTTNQPEHNLPEEEDVLPKEIPVVNISRPLPPRPFQGNQYAVVLDSTADIPDFYERIPEMAHNYQFELDIFQKQAILQLEQHNHVFVAAHTSAGKTVVAEYAIALSQKHMTRTIYTSPIKALSNQKYRDFKNTFKDVGLITGDFQINQMASCLIMTTEILRSMLYCGSEVTRDLEYVIFDEVHYINDKERGHVWEQVLMLLPSHVCVVLLSATVPNTIEFADWLGRTHQKKVYVVSTYQRPVPLEHYMYTGTGGSTKDNRFLILDSKGWKREGYIQTISSFTAKKHYAKDKDKTLWYALVDHLKNNKLLPVVAFTFSRNKCDTNAAGLRSLDLTTQREKSAIYRFFEECVKSLKEPDREIPQIKRMKDILQRGIGVHHSGILPIIKEMVEMLFQNGYIKLLFATETFAMGVNMPARTVIFDSIVKHDGRENRTLLPAEYIQMAGRAGRRGKDKKGTVIILCKYEVPDERKLQEMMLGKPNHLTSQFRLTYGTVLRFLRFEHLNVEDFISRSFYEADHQKNMECMREKLKNLEKTLSENFSERFSDYLIPLVDFYDKCREFLNARSKLHVEVICSPKVIKAIIPGRVLLITHLYHFNKLALVLSTINKANTFIFKVLVIVDSLENKYPDRNDLWYKMVALSKNHLYAPVDTPDHTILTISPKDIFEICDEKIDIDGNLIIKDWEKRQIPRFKSDPPGPTCQFAVKELVNIILSVKNENKLDALCYLDIVKDLKANESRIYENIQVLKKLSDNVNERISSVSIPNFEEQFTEIFNKKILEDEMSNLKFKLSPDSMKFIPDLMNRIQLLKELGYVGEQNRVELKGRVACEMGMNELIVTEIVLQNVLTNLQPAEVAALLSCLVFQAKTMKDESEFKLTPELSNAIEEVKSIHERIEEMENQFRIYVTEESLRPELNFKLVEVVYEWATAKPFAEIMKLTDVQEGIIVRCIQQLNETLCDVKNAARLIGDPKLQSKMEEASTAIKRDIVFAASLYTQKEPSVL